MLAMGLRCGRETGDAVNPLEPLCTHYCSGLGLWTLPRLAAASVTQSPQPRLLPFYDHTNTVLADPCTTLAFFLLCLCITAVSRMSGFHFVRLSNFMVIVRELPVRVSSSSRPPVLSVPRHARNGIKCYYNNCMLHLAAFVYALSKHPCLAKSPC